MLVKIDVGGVIVNFGEPSAASQPEPFYPYLLETGQVIDPTGEETGSTSFTLSLKAQALIDVNLRRAVPKYARMMPRYSSRESLAASPTPTKQSTARWKHEDSPAI
jgi:hypothetical protein